MTSGTDSACVEPDCDINSQRTCHEDTRASVLLSFATGRWIHPGSRLNPAPAPGLRRPSAPQPHRQANHPIASIAARRTRYAVGATVRSQSPSRDHCRCPWRLGRCLRSEPSHACTRTRSIARHQHPIPTLHTQIPLSGPPPAGSSVTRASPGRLIVTIKTLAVSIGYATFQSRLALMTPLRIAWLSSFAGPSH